MNFITKVEKAKQLIADTLVKYEKVSVACSFGKDSMVVLHLALQIDPHVPVFSVMTPFKFKETFQYKDAMTRKYKLNIVTYMREETTPIYLEDVDKCCQFYKVDMTKLAVENLDAWVTGLRRNEGRTRESYDYVEVKGGIVKVNPILDFTELDVWRYLAINKIPVHPKYGEGYRSLGCAPCSYEEVLETDTERAGRWKGTSKCGGECGIHTQVLKEVMPSN